VSTSVGLMNLIACPLGGMPMCHGSGGLAGQVAFGARTGFSVVLLGVLKIVVGLAGAAYFVGFAYHFPKAILGIWVIVAGYELVRSTAAGVRAMTAPVILTVPVVSVLSGSLPAGVGAAWLVHGALVATAKVRDRRRRGTTE